jgi:Type II secretion system (T2SS), protein E, N-terminal domain/HEAT repeats
LPRELAQLLLEEGIVSPEGLRQALTRQGEAGGTLDTALLELGLAAEAPLVAAMARAADLPPAPLSAYEQADARARRVFPSKVAERHGLAPFALDGRELSLVATCPVDLGLLDEVSFMLSLHLAPHIGPEWRVRSLIQRLYGGTLPPRLARLAELSAARGTSPGVAAAAPGPSEAGGTVMKGEEEEEAEPAHGIFLGPTMPAVSDATPSQDARAPTRAPPGLVGFTRDQGEPLEPLSAALAEALEAYEVEWSEPPPADTAVAGVGSGATEPGPAALPEAPPVAPDMLDRSAPPRWTLEQARTVLARAQTRDEVVVTALRYARDFFQFAALFAVTRDAVAGHDALSTDGDARDLARTVAIYADDPGVFRTAIETMAPYLGRVDRAAPGNQAVLDALGRGSPRTVLVTPILLRNRPVCLLYGDNGGAPVSARRLGDLLVFCSTVGAAFQRIIKSRKGDTAPTPAGAPPETPPSAPAPGEPGLAGEAPASRGMFGRPEPAWRGPSPVAPQVSAAEAQFVAAGGQFEPDEFFSPPTLPPVAESELAPAPPPPMEPDVSAEVAPPRPEPEPLQVAEPERLPPEPPLAAEPPAPAPEEPEPEGVPDDPAYLVGAFLTTAPATPARAELLARLVDHAAIAAPILCELLPGPLGVPPEALASTPAAEQGPIFEALAAMGRPAIPPLLAVLTDAVPARRRAAAVLLGAIGDPATLTALADRCLDPDPAVAEAAREALAAHRGTPAARPIPERLRRALASGLAARAAAAARALSALRDAESIPNLIQALEGTDPATAAAAAEALAAITLQRHGTAPRQWLLWWKENRGRGRAEWLFGGLTAEDREVRAAAATELARMAPPPVPYSPDMTVSEREPAARAWAGWFTRSGYRL